MWNTEVLEAMKSSKAEYTALCQPPFIVLRFWALRLLSAPNMVR